MQVAISNSREKPGASVLLFHCIFNSDGSITHFMHEVNMELYRALPHLYAVCIADNSKEHKRLTAGFVVKTSYTHQDRDFTGVLTNAIKAHTALKNIINEHSSLLPARLGIPGDAPPTENEMLRVMMTQVLKHGVGGAA